MKLNASVCVCVWSSGADICIYIAHCSPVAISHEQLHGKLQMCLFAWEQNQNG